MRRTPTCRSATKALLFVLPLLIAAGGCVSSYRQQVERVAKDWAMTIRAAQVIPVYPLTEDLQPGDVFLVDRTANEQATLYRERGFLPLDHLVTRLDVGAYDQFYRTQYFAGDYSTTTGHARPRRDLGSHAGSAPGGGGSEPFEQRFLVPRAAFPTYSVEVRRGGGFQTAIPIQAVPVGLGLTGSTSATASVNINDAYTYGGNPDTIAERLREWSESRTGRRFIAELNLQRRQNKPLFLRVVQRVYLTGGVSVTITNRAAEGAAVDAGVAQPVKLLEAGDTSALQNYTAAQNAFEDAINAALASGAAPGASIRYAAASTRSVTLQENFDRPLAIGYLAHDYEIRPDGTIGAAVSTLDVLNGRAHYRRSVGGDRAFGPLDFAIRGILDEMAESDDQLGFVRRALPLLPREVRTERAQREADAGNAPEAFDALDRAISRAYEGSGDRPGIDQDGASAWLIFDALRDARTPDPQQR